MLVSLFRMTRTVPVLRILRTAAELRPVVPARVIRAEVRVYPLPVHLPSAVHVLAPLHLARAVVRHVLVGGDSLVEEQTTLALDERAPEGDRLARCAGPLALWGRAGVEMQCLHRLGDCITPAVVEDMSLVIMGVEYVGGIGGLVVAVVGVVMLVVGCDVPQPVPDH